MIFLVKGIGGWIFIIGWCIILLIGLIITFIEEHKNGKPRP